MPMPVMGRIERSAQQTDTQPGIAVIAKLGRRPDEGQGRTWPVPRTMYL
jgi:hypothetical protein